MRKIARMLPLLALIALLAAGTTASAVPGERPQNLAVNPDGDTVLITSLSSNSITQIHNDGTPSHLDLGSSTWGVCFLDDHTAVVTHHGMDRLTVLTRPDSTQAFSAGDAVPYTFSRSLQYSTDVCAHPEPGKRTFYVANRGQGYTDGGDDSWRHTVLEFDMLGGMPVLNQVIPVDREPRALDIAIAGPNGESVLYVAHIQGNLGQDLTADTHSPVPHDGGTVLAIGLSQTFTTRYVIGSPVRDVAVRYDGAGGYRVFMTHVGEGALSEDPLNGGLLIPNVITSIGFDSSHDYVDRQNIMINHESVLDSGDLPAVVPEQVAFTTYTVGNDTHHYAWITNSASGTVTRLVLDADGTLPMGASPFSLVDLAQNTGAAYEVVTGRSSKLRIQTTAADSTLVTDRFLMPAAADVKVVSVDATGTSMALSSVPRGIVADPDGAAVRLVTDLDMQMVELDAELAPTQAPNPSFVSVVSTSVTVGDAERAFFTAGEGFVFRETGTSPAAEVDNLSCTTCHPGGHHDAKIHISAAVTQTEPVATPSIFDVGNTEWLFFNGLRTIVDDDATGCSYCLGARFFATTKDFTDDLVGPASPYTEAATVAAPAGLADAAATGRAWFDAMECSRCHQSQVGTFPRTNESGLGMGDSGPIETVNATRKRMLNDRTQVFVSLTGNLTNTSVRNKSVVGSRSWETGVFRAVNTPSLAGGWDNRPYMHDGRYPTLASVLDNTWLDSNTDCGEARMVSADPWECQNLGSVPDNWRNQDDVAAGAPLVIFDSGIGFNFGSHASPAPLGRTSVKSHLTTQGVYDEMIAFLNVISSHTDPCDGSATLALESPKAIYDAQDNETTVTWDSTIPVASRLSASWSNGSASWHLDPDTQHEMIIDHAADPALAVTMDARLDLCGKVAASISLDLDGVDTWTATTTLACDVSTLGWHTDIQTGCLLEWGIKNRNGVYTHSVTTSAKLIHTLEVSVAPGDRYMARVTPLMPGAASRVFYWNASPCASGGGGFGKAQDLAGIVTGVRSIYPNPFNPSTTVSFGMEQSGQVTVRVYDVSGRLVRTLANREYPAGSHDLVWNGKDERGRGVASGTYLVRFETGDVQEVQRIALLK